MAEYFTVLMYHILSIHKLMGICFYFLAIMNNAAVNMYVQVFLCVSIISLGHITIDLPNTELVSKDFRLVVIEYIR